MKLHRLFLHRYKLILTLAVAFPLALVTGQTNTTTATTATAAITASPLAFPGAEGFGSTTTGGRGGAILRVTSLADTGESGTLRWAVNQPGARVIVFEVSGYIDLQSNLKIPHGDLTILGQTAPGDGITLRYGSLLFAEKIENVIIRFIRVRYGNVLVEGDALDGRYLSRIIVDHCSFSWSVDECASIYASNLVTFQWNIVSESLNRSGHIKGDHGYGGNWGGVNTSFHHNLLANNNGRSPRIDGILDKMESDRTKPSLDGFCDVRNNVIFNYGGPPYGGEGRKAQFINNQYLPGPKTLAARSERFIFYATGKRPLYPEDRNAIMGDYENALRAGTLDPKFTVNGKVAKPVGEIYVEGNIVEGRDDLSANNASGVRFEAAELAASILRTEPYADPRSSVRTDTAADAYVRVLAGAGMSRARDAVDTRVLAGVAAREGIIVDVPEDVGGYPKLSTAKAPKDKDKDGMPDDWEKANGLDPANATDAWEIFIDENAQYPEVSGRFSNLEVYAYSLVKHIEGCAMTDE